MSPITTELGISGIVLIKLDTGYRRSSGEQTPLPACSQATCVSLARDSAALGITAAEAQTEAKLAQSIPASTTTARFRSGKRGRGRRDFDVRILRNTDERTSAEDTVFTVVLCGV